MNKFIGYGRHTLICEHCGTSIDLDKDKVCPNCKAPFSKNQDYNEYKEKLSIANATISIDENNKPVFRCTIAGEGFVEGYGKDDTVEDVKTKTAKADKPKKARKHPKCNC